MYRVYLSLTITLALPPPQTYLILEDDVVFVEQFGAQFRRAMQQLPWRWDMLYLGYNSYFQSSKDCHRRDTSPCSPGSEYICVYIYIYVYICI